MCPTTRARFSRTHFSNRISPPTFTPASSFNMPCAMISDTRHVKLIRSILTPIFLLKGIFTCGGCLDPSPRVPHYRSQISLLSAICGASPGQPPWPRSSFLDVGDGQLLATRGAASATGESESVSARDTPWSE